MTDFSFENPTDELINVISVESTTLQRRLDEIYQQIETYEQMVKREETRNADVAAAMRTLQDNFDTVPREDIRSRYEEAIETRFRLATMRGQLEQFKATQQLIEEEQKLLKDVLNRIDSGIELKTDGDAGDSSGSSAMSSGTMNIIRIVQAQEDERRRLANQMHDGPAQSLTNFVLQAEICQRLFDRNPEGAREELVNLKESASVTFQRVRDFIADLRPMMLDDLGILPTVRRWGESFETKSDINVTIDLDGEEERRLKEYQEVMLFRGIQDLMGHARDFADATKITLRLEIGFDRAEITIEDNGRAFDAEMLTSEDHPDDARAQGLITLREKFELVGGEVSINRNEKDITEAHITMPVEDR
jgi:two-component system sensor histidine kinase DegS